MSFVTRAGAPGAPAPASALLQPALQPPPPSPVPGPEWRVLIVDSDPDVHAAFRLALEGHSLFGRPLVFLYARSGTQARNLLRSEQDRSEEHTSELQSHSDLVCRLLLEKKKKKTV